MWTYPAGSIRGTWNGTECHLQALCNDSKMMLMPHLSGCHSGTTWTFVSGCHGCLISVLDDNARPHRANIVDECLQSEDITLMYWPAYSPELNPIEYVWNMLGRQIAARQPPHTCLPELRRALLDEWCNIPQDQIDNLILTMPRRCKAACIASSGIHSPY
ncbi:DDE_3 domain-containing protein [Trichonephila clavipes]|nr:DDE_3 domain-containing protein [Trichonephila clavipes]